MANLASSAVTVNAYYTGMGSNAKRYTFAELTLVLTGQGSATNKILASVLQMGFVTLKGCGTAVKSDNTVVLPAVPSTDGTFLLLGGGASNAPADYTGTFNITVWGQT